jgi:hypothetical protein
MFDRIKQGANLAKFKADQLLREQRVQNEIGGVNQQLNAMKDRIAVVVLDLHKNQPLGMPELDDLCAQADALMAQIAQKEAQIAAIRAEQAPQAAPPPPAYGTQPGYPPQPAYVPPPQAAPAVKPCPNCNASVPVAAMFCTSCGYSFQAAPAAPVAPPRPATQICPHCQAEAPATSAFCPNCGKSMAN